MMMSLRFPSHLMLPKGKKNGMPYSMMVMVTPYMKNRVSMEKGKMVSDEKPLGYPFDRKVMGTEFEISNFFEKEVYIYHKKTDEHFETI